MKGRDMHHQRGLTMLELLMVLVLAAIGLTAAVAIFGSTDKMVQHSHARLQAAAHHRASLAALAHLLRSAEGATLAGFDDVTGVATQPSFETVLGYESGRRIRAGTLRLEWRASATDVDDVEAPGDVVAVDASGTRVIAAQVPQGGFEVRLEGLNLVIRLTTYHATSTRQVAELTSETSVSLRN